MSQPATKEFGRWRSFFWPVHKFELKKLLPMFLLFFFINFNYTILRDTKDSLIVTSSGAETLAFLKVWAVLPLAIVFMIIYSKLSNIMSKQKLFVTTISFFAGFFALFATVLYPFHEALHPTALADAVQAYLPKGMAGFVDMFRHWTYSLFYVMSELWGSVAMSLLFWGFANDTTKVSESKRFYALFGLGANLAMYPSGMLVKKFAGLSDTLPANVDAWGVTLNYTLFTVVIAAACVIGVYLWINKKVLTDPRFFDPNEVKKAKKEKPKMSLKESFLFLARSPYIGCLAILVIAYGVAINLVEVTWKSQLKLQYPTHNEYQNFMGGFSMMTATATILMMLFVGGNVIRKFGWGVGALITPVVLLITGIGFFSSIMFRETLTGFVAMMGTTPLMMAIVFGTAQNFISKSAKYSLFDPTKEMAYIPLDQESKVKGKAAIDVVGARAGKAGGALIQQGLFLFIGPVAVCTPYIAAILFAIIAAWIFAAKSLNKQFVTLSAQKDAERVAEEAALEVTKAPKPATAPAPAEIGS